MATSDLSFQKWFSRTVYCFPEVSPGPQEEKVHKAAVNTLVWLFRTGFSFKCQSEAANNLNGNVYGWHMWHTSICKGHAPGEELCAEVRAQAKRTTGPKLTVTMSASFLRGEKILSQYHFEQGTRNFP